MRKINRSMKVLKKAGVVAALGFVIVASVTGCNNGNGENETSAVEQSKKADITIPAKEAAETEVMVVGDAVVYLDEVRYYSYNTQATYEAVYIAEDEALDWNSEMSEGVTLEEAVKSTVLDRICEREALVQYAEEYGVAFTETELSEISDKVDTFFEESNPKLLERIDIEKERLKEVFEKEELYKKVKEVMDDEEAGKSDETYKNWKKVNNVTTNEYWNAINFKTPILK